MMAVDFESGSPPRIGTPRLLFEIDPQLRFYGNPVWSFDVTPDGQRFYVVQAGPAPPPPVVTHINLIQNWFEELKAKVQSGQATQPDREHQPADFQAVYPSSAPDGNAD